ncbi:MAG: 16S rRNA (guanine(527)-N(7))-methyltransferase RsmG [Chloroflexi bacterium]|nr:16S rRNA (guanine(527)-N(7))-methyltransferase RsmG [Chloroflexota bacterium]
MTQVEVLRKGVQRLGLDLGEDQVLLFQRYLQELLDWNRRVNLTAIVENREVQVKHFLDSLTVSLVIPREVTSGGSLIDIGSGGGFPGLPLKILWPSLRVTLAESVGKKAAFLRYVTDTLGLEGVEVHCQRAESLAHHPHLRETFDVVVARAVAELNVLAELTLPFCKLGGRVVAQKKSGIEDEIKRAERAVSLLGGVLERVEEVHLEEIGETRWLVVLAKNAPSPSSYPRRPGLPAKRPL